MVNELTGIYLKQIRKDKKISQCTIAEHLRTSAQFISNIEAGRSPLPVRYVRAYAAILGIDPILVLEEMTNDYSRHIHQLFRQGIDLDA